MRIVATSDTHGILPRNVPPCDIFIHAGDFTPVHDHSRAFQKDWLNEWANWLDKVPSQMAVWICGNHDFIGQTDPDLLGFARTYLNNTSCEYDGIKIWGSPYSGTFGNWAFMREEDELKKIWDTIPDDTNIIVVHGPPYGYGDRVLYPNERDPHVGSPSLTQRISELSDLDLVVCGHIHEAAGVFENPYCQVANVSYVDLSYRPRGHFYTFEI